MKSKVYMIVAASVCVLMATCAEAFAQQQQQEEQPKPSDEEKARQYAASVLRSHLDEEKGSPIPHADVQVRPPDKDY